MKTSKQSSLVLSLVLMKNYLLFWHFNSSQKLLFIVFLKNFCKIFLFLELFFILIKKFFKILETKLLKISSRSSLSIKKFRTNINFLFKWHHWVLFIFILNCFSHLGETSRLKNSSIYISKKQILTLSNFPSIKINQNNLVKQISFNGSTKDFFELNKLKTNLSQINDLKRINTVNKILNEEGNLEAKNNKLKKVISNKISLINQDNITNSEKEINKSLYNQYLNKESIEYDIIDEIKINKSGYKNVLEIKFMSFNRSFELELEKNDQILFENFTIRNLNNEKTKKIKLNNNNCFYNGKIKNDKESFVSLSICDGLTGMIQTEGEFYFIKCLNNESINFKKKVFNYSNLKFKNFKKGNHLIKKVKDLSFLKKNTENVVRKIIRTKRYSNNLSSRINYNNPIIELAVFADESLYKYLKNTYFIKTDHQIVTFILTILNGIQTLYNQFNKYDINLKFSIVLLEIMKEQPKELVATDLQEKYLFRFCDWQEKRKFENSHSKYGNWDHAILLTGLDLARLDKRTNKKIDSVIGSALVGKMCTESSCSISEGTLLGTILVMAHEIGHSMDLSHDGDLEHSGTNDCQNEKYIMTSSLKPGVYLFSKCSVEELKNYLKGPNSKCLFVNNSKLRLSRKFLNEFNIKDADNILGSWDRSKYLPGQSYTIDEQCALQYGKKSFYAPTKFFKFCEAVTCKLNNTFHEIRYAHPTLEGTVCGVGKWCLKGQCVDSKFTEINNILNNEVINKNPYLIDSNVWKSSKKYIKTLKIKPEWKIFENNHDTSINQILLDKNNSVFNKKLFFKNITSNEERIFKKKIFSLKHKYVNQTNLKEHWFDLIFKKVSMSNTIEVWSNWSNWSSCFSECIIEDNKIPIGFQLSTRKCNSVYCKGNSYRLKLCNSNHICSKSKSIKTVKNYSIQTCNNIFDYYNLKNSNQSNKIETDRCSVKCIRNSIHKFEWQLPDTSPCSTDNTNSFCYKGKCKNFDCSGLSLKNSKPCKNRSARLTVINIEEKISNEWYPISYCKQTCLRQSRGVQLAYQKICTGNCDSLEKQSFQLCAKAEEDCLEKDLKHEVDYADEICSRYKIRYPSLFSGKGKQLAPREDNLNLPCFVSCSDYKLSNVYYEMNSTLDGQFPLGTNCTFNSSIQSYCINGNCVQFGIDDTPIDKNFNNFYNLRKEFSREMMYRNRHR